MRRVAFLFGLLVLAATAAGCKNDCNRASDCTSTQVCYRGTCTAALLDELACTTDDDCGMPGAMGARAYLCFAGRCRQNPALQPTGTSLDATVLPDTGVADGGGPTD